MSQFSQKAGPIKMTVITSYIHMYVCIKLCPVQPKPAAETVPYRHKATISTRSMYVTNTRPASRVISHPSLLQVTGLEAWYEKPPACI